MLWCLHIVMLSVAATAAPSFNRIVQHHVYNGAVNNNHINVNFATAIATNREEKILDKIVRRVMTRAADLVDSASSLITSTNTDIFAGGIIERPPPSSLFNSDTTLVVSPATATAQNRFENINSSTEPIITNNDNDDAVYDEYVFNEDITTVAVDKTASFVLDNSAQVNSAAAEESHATLPPSHTTLIPPEASISEEIINSSSISNSEDTDNSESHDSDETGTGGSNDLQDVQSNSDSSAIDLQAEEELDQASVSEYDEVIHPGLSAVPMQQYSNDDVTSHTSLSEKVQSANSLISSIASAANTFGGLRRRQGGNTNNIGTGVYDSNNGAAVGFGSSATGTGSGSFEDNSATSGSGGGGVGSYVAAAALDSLGNVQQQQQQQQQQIASDNQVSSASNLGTAVSTTKKPNIFSRIVDKVTKKKQSVSAAVQPSESTSTTTSKPSKAERIRKAANAWREYKARNNVVIDQRGSIPSPPPVPKGSWRDSMKSGATKIRSMNKAVNIFKLKNAKGR